MDLLLLRDGRLVLSLHAEDGGLILRTPLDKSGGGKEPIYGDMGENLSRIAQLKKDDTGDYREDLTEFIAQYRRDAEEEEFASIVRTERDTILKVLNALRRKLH